MSIITHICGGLGNQMFQYATARTIALTLKAELKLDLSWFDNTAGDTPRRYMLNDAFDLSITIASQTESNKLIWRKESILSKLLRRFHRHQRPHALEYVQEPGFAYWPEVAQISTPAYLSGYWQDERYFKAMEAYIRQDFTFNYLPTEIEPIANTISQTPNTVAIHIRRGDYQSNPHINQTHGLCSPLYYGSALSLLIDKVGPELFCFLFSDDPDWVRQNFNSQGLPATVIEFKGQNDTPWHDMHLMSLCKHHVIANSSFSWWGAWLSKQNGIICSPRQWFANTATICGNPAPDRWISL